VRKLLLIFLFRSCSYKNSSLSNSASENVQEVNSSNKEKSSYNLSNSASENVQEVDSSNIEKSSSNLSNSASENVHKVNSSNNERSVYIFLLYLFFLFDQVFSTIAEILSDIMLC